MRSRQRGCKRAAAAAVGTAVVAVSFDGDSHVSAAAGGAALTFYDPSAPPAIYSAEPPYAEVHASTRIILHGSNFAPASGGAPSASYTGG